MSGRRAKQARKNQRQPANRRRWLSERRLAYVAAAGALVAVTVGGIAIGHKNGGTSPIANASALAGGISRTSAAAPALRGTDPIDGRQVSLVQFAGKPVVLNVWASWCTGCNQEAADLHRFAVQHPSAQVLGIDTQDTTGGARAFYRKWHWQHPSIADPHGSLGGAVSALRARVHTRARTLAGTSSALADGQHHLRRAPGRLRRAARNRRADPINLAALTLHRSDRVTVAARGPVHRIRPSSHRSEYAVTAKPTPLAQPVADEARLVARARERDAASFEQLIVAQAAPLQRMLRRMLGSTADAEEVLQETFLKAWQAIERFRGDAQFSTWLYRIAVNEARRKQAYDSHRRALPIDDVMVELPDLPAGPAALAESAELEAFIEQCVAELPASYREAVVLRDVEGLANEEAAAVLELDLRNFKSRLHRGRMAIRRQVEERYG